MRFSIHTGNHQNSPGIADTVLFLQCALRQCGHEARIDAAVVPGRYNIVLEHFVDDLSMQRITEGHAAGARFILIGTEPIVAGTFNGGVVQSHWHYSNAPYWQLRHDAFMHMARYADAVWVLAESMVEGYRAALPGLPVVFLPHGHVEGFERFQHRPDAEKNIDFYFSGSLTDHRRALLEDLARHGHHVVVDNQATPDYLRFEHLSRSKVCLSLRLSPDNRIPSVSRMHFHLQHRNYLIHERYELPCVLDPYVLHVPTEDWVEWASAAIEVSSRREVADAVHAKFRDEMSMSELLPRVLEASGIASVKAAEPRPHAPPASPNPAAVSPSTELAAPLPPVADPDAELALAALHSIHFMLTPEQRDAAAAAIALGVNERVPSLDGVRNEAVLSALATDGLLSLGPVLEPSQVDEVVNHFMSRPCYDAHVASQSDGVARPFAEASKQGVYGSYSLQDSLEAPHLVELALNKHLLAQCEHHLGCVPTLYSVHVWWTFAGHPQQGLTHGYHRDPDDHRFLAMFMYLTDVQMEDGPIDFLRGTHRPEVVESALAEHREDHPASRSIEVGRFFPPLGGDGYDNAPGKVPVPYEALFARHKSTLTGPAGTGFLADTFALHRGNPPTRHHRLACWIRYGLSKHRIVVEDKTRPVAASCLGGRVPRSPQLDWITRLVIDQRH